mgnify:CR=1 FL=1
MTTTARVDAWLWAVRVYKTRSAATTACRAGHVRVNGEKAKAAQTVKPGDEVRVRISGFDRMLVVRQTIVKRVGASVAAEAVEDRTPLRHPGSSLHSCRCAIVAQDAPPSASAATSRSSAGAEPIGATSHSAVRNDPRTAIHSSKASR